MVKKSKYLVAASLGVLTLTVAAFFALDSPQPREGLLADPVDPRYPDLAMAPLDIQGIAVAEDSTWRLRFSATIVNIGEGDFLASAYRSSWLSDWEVRQRIPDADDRFTERSTPATLVWGGDGHDHWHVRDVETHWIETMDGQEIAGVVKEGFCFFDNVHHDLSMPHAPSAPQFSGSDCGDRFDRSIVMGLSPGWGDLYPWNMFEQQIDVTGISDGRYRVSAVADPADWFSEVDETNNGTWAVIDIALDETGFPEVKVVEVAPAR